MFTAQTSIRRAAAALLATLFLALCVAGPVHAHARLVGSDPSADATVSALKTIQLHFSEEIATKFSSVKLTHTDGTVVSIMSMAAKDAKSLSVMPNAALLPGLYTVSWTAVATDDGHKTMGTFSFTVK